MPLFKRMILAVIMTLFLADAWSQTGEKPPYIGYLYPAGGRQGTVFQIKAGGQNLKGVDNVYISGEGVSAKVVQYMRPLTNEQKRELQKRIREIRQKLTAQKMPGKRLTEKENKPPRPIKKGAESTTETVALPDYPLLRNLDNMSLKDLKIVEEEYLNTKKNQQGKGVLAEIVLIEVTIEADAATGDREIRLGAPAGLTNPQRFQVGLLPEICEEEPNDPNEPVIQLIDIPSTLNGQIKPGDVDRFRFKAKSGQNLVFEVQARSLIPYLADAVPGWFQPVLTLYDTKGNELAFDDDYRFNPDPVLFYKVSKDDEYLLEIRDSIYRGRDDFVYRITAGEVPFITGIFPLGGREGVPTTGAITGWNLDARQVTLDTQPGGDSLRHITLRQNKWLSNKVPYMVNDLPESLETEPNDTITHAQAISLPRIVNGRIEKPGDIDTFKFTGKAGDELVAEVYARRLQSPLDSLLRLTNEKGRLLAFNDDFEDKASGLETHHADSYLSARLPEDGVYIMEISDTQNKGGDAYAYRLRISPPQPDFALRMTPSTINVPAGGIVCIDVYAIRKDGFDGDINMEMKDPPKGFKLSGGRIPSGRENVRMTLMASMKPLNQPVALNMEGQAQIGGENIVRPVLPSENMMQAFAYYHLVTSQELMVDVIKTTRRAMNMELVGKDGIEIPAGGTCQVAYKLPPRFALKDIQMQLNEPPKGISLRDVFIKPGSLTFLLEADGKAAKAGLKDNLIVEAFTERDKVRKDGKKTGEKQRISLGVLPAIPVEIVKR